MKVNELIKKCVCFVALQKYSGEFNLVGTAFFVVNDNNRDTELYAITAKHVIVGIKNKGLEKVFFRMNLRNGTFFHFETNLKDWIFHPDENTDIAMFSFGVKLDYMFDHYFFPTSRFVDEQYLISNEVEPGDEVFIIGLFRHYSGQRKNLPIVRIGNIAAMDDEKIQTKWHLMEGYLIEARSIGGLSGSPVFTNLGIQRAFSSNAKPTGHPVSLLGLIYGHFDSFAYKLDESADLEEDKISVNTGIAIVTPISKLLELLPHMKQ